MEIENGEVFIEDVMLAPVKGHFPTKERISDQDTCITKLPADALSALSLLAPITDNLDSRAHITRIHLGDSTPMAS